MTFVDYITISVNPLQLGHTLLTSHVCLGIGIIKLAKNNKH